MVLVLTGNIIDGERWMLLPEFRRVLNMREFACTVHPTRGAFEGGIYDDASALTVPASGRTMEPRENEVVVRVANQRRGYVQTSIPPHLLTRCNPAIGTEVLVLRGLHCGRIGSVEKIGKDGRCKVRFPATYPDPGESDVFPPVDIASISGS
ncbi:hypothetical protein BC834DRAFT_66925 [Gloeopeniophorella convolvens]|nr:hypothetical protein BC834DRAFT_66925 [Gloeopeniophorella convolvens]